MSKPPPAADQAARDYVIGDRAHNLWVEAGAGTGKTTLLVERILSLLLDDTRPLRLQRVAAITFTEKAAGELKVKIRQEIEKRLVDSNYETRRDVLTTALRDLETAAIGTLHSFAGMLIRERPVEAKIDPRAATLDQGQHDGLMTEVFDQWFDELVHDASPPPVFGWYLRDKNYSKRRDENDWLWTLAKAVVANADVLLSASLPPPADPEIERLWETIREEAPRALEHARGVAKKQDDKAILQLEAFLAGLAEVPAPSTGDAFFDATASLPKFNLGSGNKQTKENRSLLREHVDQITTVRHDTKMRELFELARDYARRFEAERERRGALSFQDLLVKAAAMLREDKDVRAYFQGRFDAVLIDEFQDTDPLQVEVAFFLCEKGARADTVGDVELESGKLMVVGDPKQSIYRFRRADIEVYENTKKHLLDNADPTLITVNFRCAAGIIETVNGMFEHLMELDPERPVSPDYIALQTGRSAWPTTAGVTFLMPDEPAGSAGEVCQREFAAVADWLRRNQAAGLEVFDRKLNNGQGGMRPMSWSDVAILDRRTSNFNELEQALRRAGVPYRTEGGKVFYSREEIAAVVCGITALEDADDSAALAQWLGSDLVGFADQDLLGHFLARGDKQFSYMDLDEDLLDPVADALRHMRRLHERRNRVGCAATVRGLFDAFSALPQAYTLPRAEVAVANLHKVLDAARGADRDGLRFDQFVRQWRDAFNEQRDESDFVVTEDADDVVHIMTIHKAKGLDWPIVVLIDLGGDVTRRYDTVLFRRQTGELAVRVKKGYETANYNAMSDVEYEFEDAERVRQLYVAMTRAQDHLLVPLFGKVKKKKAPQKGYLKFLVKAEVIDDEITMLKPCGAAVQTVTVADLDTDLAHYWRLPQEFRDRPLSKTERAVFEPWLHYRPTTLPPLPPPVEFRPPSEHAGGPPVGGTSYGLAMGQAFHVLVERVDLADPLADDESLRAVAAESELDDEQTQTLHRWLRNLTAMPEFTAATAGRVWREASFTWTNSEGVAYAGQIDMLAETADGLWVLDYKTDGVNPEQVEARAAFYESQGRVYRDAVRSLAGVEAVRMVLCFVDAAVTVEIS
ncbi:MAG: UvrD-helicase domain-containing protein [Candidatus Lernaella stagnicola]|nr:UvrD-helicase domain-containing protein [Candidatus Lernaella stagnicola]